MNLPVGSTAKFDEVLYEGQDEVFPHDDPHLPLVDILQVQVGTELFDQTLGQAEPRPADLLPPRRPPRDPLFFAQ